MTTLPRNQVTALEAVGSSLGRYNDGSRIPSDGSPRPYLHPLWTLRGVPVTEAGAVDHPHHLGLSTAIPSVSGIQYWGGRSYVRDRGYEELHNQGSEQRRCLETSPSGELLESLEWVPPHSDTVQITERRSILSRIVDPSTWALQWSSVLTATDDCEIGSPATEGRTGVGYGGLFWRFPSWRGIRVFSGRHDDADSVYGSSDPWVALSCPSVPIGVVLHQTGPVPFEWFVRTEEYVGLCLCPAWEHVLPLAAGETLELSMTALIADVAWPDAFAVDRVLENVGP